MRRFLRLYGPGMLLLALFVALPAVASAQGAPNPQGVTNQACTFGTTWTGGITRWIFGASIVFLLLGAMGGLTAARSGGGGGAEVAGHAIGGLVGVALVMALIGAVGLLSSIAIVAAGGQACP